MRAAARLLLPLLAAALAGCAGTASLFDFDAPAFETVVSRYSAMEDRKALALATEANGRFAWGIATGEASEADARAGAADRCRRAARSGGMRADCHAFAVDDAPARDTVEGCAARQLPSRRCFMQRQFQGKLGR